MEYWSKQTVKSPSQHPNPTQTEIAGGKHAQILQNVQDHQPKIDLIQNPP